MWTQKQLLLILYYFFVSFSTNVSWWSGWQQVSSSLQDPLSILSDLNNAVVWSVLDRPPISNSSSPLKSLDPSNSTNYNQYQRHPQAFSYLVNYISLFRFLCSSRCGPPGQQVHSTAGSLFYLCIFVIVSKSGLLTRIRWFVCLQNPIDFIILLIREFLYLR